MFNHHLSYYYKKQHPKYCWIKTNFTYTWLIVFLLLSELQDTLLHRMKSAYTCLFKSQLLTKIMCLAKSVTREPASYPTLFQWLSWVFCVATWCSYDLVSDLLYVRMDKSYMFCWKAFLAIPLEDFFTLFTTLPCHYILYLVIIFEIFFPHTARYLVLETCLIPTSPSIVDML